MQRCLPMLLMMLCLSSCAEENFFQEDALATEAEVKGKAPAGPDSAWVTAGRHYDRSGFHRFFWGDHNRDIWTTPVKVPVFKMDSLFGGLTIVKKGGGFQTTSFTLQDSTGRLYAFRSLDKDPVDVVPPFWRKTFVANVLRDQTSAANPYGALVMPVLAEAVGVFHTNPSIYYVASTDTSFGQYAPEAQGKLFLLQEKFETVADLTPSFGGVINFADSDKAFHNRFERNTYRFNQKAFARARLLDIFAGDWDRHKGQWEWALQKEGIERTYLPIPKDRDQVFMKMNDGFVPAIATSKFIVRKFHSFDDDFDDVKAYMINAEFLDERLLNELSLADWQQIASSMQKALTDEVIETAVSRLPQPIYHQIGKKLINNLISRRDLLPEVAEKMYRILAEKVTVAGTDAKEQFIVNRLNDEETEVSMYRKATSNLPGKQLYHRIFNRKETKEVTLHGLAGDDTFLMKGNVKDGILIKLFGGLGEDTIADSSSVKGLKKMTRIYDTERGNEIYFGSEARDMTTRDVRVHAYDREGN